MNVVNFEPLNSAQSVNFGIKMKLNSHLRTKFALNLKSNLCVNSHQSANLKLNFWRKNLNQYEN